MRSDGFLLMRSRLVLPLLLLTGLLAACASQPTRRVSRIALPSAGVPLTRVVARTSQTSQTACDTDATASAPLVSGSHEGTISTAYHDILREFIRPLDTSSLLNAAWQGASDEATKEGDANTGVTAPQLDNTSADNDWNSFAAAYDQLSDLTEGQVDQQKMAFAAVNQMAVSVNEGHTYFLDPEEYGQQSAGSEESISGIGVVLNGKQAPFIVEEVVPGAPADQAGIKPGDSITAVDGCDVSNWNSLKLSTHVRGTAGTSVHLALNRESTGTVNIDITRAQITFPAIEEHVLPSGIGYVHLHQFPSPTAVLSDGKPLGPDLDSILASFQSSGARGWLLDLRGNPGGRVDALQAVGGRILPTGTMFSFTDRAGHSVTERTIGNRVDTPPLLAVLVDAQSASAAEILSSAVQDESVAPIIGSTTAGVANGAELLGVGDNAGLSITHWQTYTLSGRALNGSGVTPDMSVERTPEDLAAGADPPLQAAIALAPANPSAASRP